MGGIRSNLGAFLMQIDFLIAENERPAPVCKADGPHIEQLRIKRNASINVGHRQYQMVKSRDVHSHLCQRRHSAAMRSTGSPGSTTTARMPRASIAFCPRSVQITVAPLLIMRPANSTF